jgi:nitrogenase molybdenum-iron protein alpha/beta subunit
MMSPTCQPKPTSLRVTDPVRMCVYFVHSPLGCSIQT